MLSIIYTAFPKSINKVYSVSFSLWQRQTSVVSWRFSLGTAFISHSQTSLAFMKTWSYFLHLIPCCFHYYILWQKTQNNLRRPITVLAASGGSMLHQHTYLRRCISCILEYKVQKQLCCSLVILIDRPCITHYRCRDTYKNVFQLWGDHHETNSWHNHR